MTFGQPVDPGRRQGAACGLRRSCAAGRRSLRPNTGSSARTRRGSTCRASSRARASYVQDMVLPGMLHARILRPPRPFAKLRLDSRSPGTGEGRQLAGVLAEREEDAIEAAKKLRAKAVWSDGPAMPQDIYAWMKAHVAKSSVAKEEGRSGGEGARREAVQAEYRKPFICHASIGPSCALAWMKGDTLEVWSHTQGIFNLRKEIALVLRMPEDKVIVHHAEGAGCYGHNGADDVALDAALLARLSRGLPVRLQWTREDEFAWEPYGPAMARRAWKLHLDAQGSIVSWRHDLWSNGHTHRPGRADQPVLIAARRARAALRARAGGRSAAARRRRERNAVPGYEFPDLKVMHHYVRESAGARLVAALARRVRQRFRHRDRSWTNSRLPEGGSGRFPAEAPEGSRVVVRWWRRLFVFPIGILFQKRRKRTRHRVCPLQERRRLLRGGRRRSRRAAPSCASRAWSPRSTSACRSIPTASSTRSRAAACRRRAGR